MEELFKLINEKVKNKIFTIESPDSLYDGCKFKFQIVRMGKLISMGEWENYVFVSVVITSLGNEERTKLLGEYLDGNHWDGRIEVERHAFRTSSSAAQRIQKFLNHFNIDDGIVVDSLKYNLEDKE